MLSKLITFLALYLPFQLALNPAAGIDLASVRVFILLIFFFWLADSLKNKKFIIQKNWTTAFVGIFLFLNLFSIFFARNPDWSLRKLLYLFSIFPIYFVASTIINNQEKAKKLLSALVLSGALASLIGILQFLSQFIFGLDNLLNFWKNHFAVPFLGRTFSQSVFEYSSWLVNISGQTYFRAISVFPDPHMFSMYLGLLWPISLFLYIKHPRKIWLFSTILIFLADILTFSRGGYLGLFFGAIILFFVFWKKISPKFKLGGLVVASLFIIFFTIPNPITTRFFSSFDPNEGSNAGRLAMWRAAEKEISEKPIFGTGLGNFPLAVNPRAAYRQPIYAHNTYLDIAVETGLPSALAFLGILLSAIFYFIKKSKNDIAYSGLAIGLVIFSVHSLVETGIYSPVVLTLLLFLVSLASVQKVH